MPDSTPPLGEITYADTFPAGSGPDFANEVASRFYALKYGVNFAFQDRGVYDSSFAYAKNDVVIYPATGGLDYRALVPSTGVTPGTDSAKWRVFAAGALPASGVTAGTYTRPTLTITSDGRVTAAANGAAFLASNTVTASATLAPAAGVSRFVQRVNATSATTQTLPDATLLVNQGVLLTVKNVSTGTVTIAAFGAQTIDGAASKTLSTQWTSLDFYSTNSGWETL